MADLIRTFRLLNAEQRVAAVGAVLLVVSTFGPFSFVEAAELLIAFGVLALREREIVLRDLDRGLIDFPSLRGEREVYLCWEEGEPEIGYWHDPGAGFAGRRRLDDG